MAKTTIIKTEKAHTEYFKNSKKKQHHTTYSIRKTHNGTYKVSKAIFSPTAQKYYFTTIAKNLTCTEAKELATSLDK